MKLVLLHALPLDARMWEGLAVPGIHGGDILAPNLFSLGDSIESWAHAVLAQVGSDELIVVGCSVGGSCALEIAAAAPEQVAGIVLIGAKAGVNPDPRLRDEALQLLRTQGVEAAWHRYWLPLFSEATPASVKDKARKLAMEQPVELVTNGVRAFHDRRDLSAFVDGWRRTLIGISGADDVAPAPSKLEQLTTRQGRAFHLVPECGHYVNLEQPALFEELLADAVRRIESAHGRSGT